MQEEKIMDRIQKLLDKAMSTEFEPEQQALLQKADALMMQYSIDQIQLSQRQATDSSVKGQVPVFKICIIQADRIPNDPGAEIYYALSSMFQNLVTHFHCRTTYKLPEASGGGHAPSGSLVVVGYPSDIEFLEMMFLQLKMHMLSNLAPMCDPDRPWVVSVANFKNTGFKWEQIHRMMQDHPDYPRRGESWSKSAGLTMYNQYKKFVEAAGEEYVGTSSPATWRSDFIAGYVSRIAVRLREMRAQTVAEGDNLPALFKDKTQEVQETFWDLFPESKPHDPNCECTACEQRRKPVKMTGPGSRGGGYRFRYRNAGAMGAGAKVANTADLSPRGGRVSSSNKGELR